ncbi:amino acid adenylation domain-containing protein [Novosphingobium sp. CF614]|uniref:non-ribosomal peptide synthetase n=1 Tax=Novosphingobium sp. CF614 TaxID=1884364 RepID=UPI0008E9ED63|nr:non-ribosomal peptide synthetase [Novosphingobium sp. CF614]SFG29324.1 amino acid adenylation domain-containing protein [Novosphingobium sp. CF614]
MNTPPDYQDTSPSALPRLTGTEQALHEALASPGPVRGVEMIPDLLVRWALQRPLASALEHRGTVWTYGDLEEQTRRLACHLIAKGIRAGDRVALVMPRSPCLVLALHAVLRAGATFVPIDPDWPEARRATIIEQAAPAFIWNEAAVDVMLGHDTPLDPIPLPSPSMMGAAYILFTSGSTGTPKGVIVEHAQLASYVAAARDALGLAQCSRFALSSTVAADLGHTTLFGSLAVGATLIVAGNEDMADGQAFASFITERAVDCIKISPSHLAALLEGSESLLPATIILGGEPLPRRLVDDIRRRSPEARIFNHYGPTETTVGAMIHRVPAAPASYNAPPLDQPLPGCRILLRAPDFTRTPVGDVGEVYIGGPQVARGYLGQPANCAFLDDPERPGERLYRTGDLARLNRDGSLSLVGRTDDQVKIRGFRIELAEVEAALLDLPEIAQAATILQGEEDARQLVAYVVARQGCVTDPKMIGEKVRGRLPEAAVPSAILTLPDLPRLANGKIDREALKARPMTDSHPLDSTPAGASADPLEALIIELVSDLLRTVRVGREDNIFDLGAHSLIVIKLAARLRKRLEMAVAPSAIFDHPSPALLAERLRSEGVTPGKIPMPA